MKIAALIGCIICGFVGRMKLRSRRTFIDLPAFEEFFEGVVIPLPFDFGTSSIFCVPFEVFSAVATLFVEIVEIASFGGLLFTGFFVSVTDVAEEVAVVVDDEAASTADIVL